jgi:hypothetical protein
MEAIPIADRCNNRRQDAMGLKNSLDCSTHES